MRKIPFEGIKYPSYLGNLGQMGELRKNQIRKYAEIAQMADLKNANGDTVFFPALSKGFFTREYNNRL